MALPASMWILPGLLGPPAGAVLAAAMVMPSLRRVSVRKEGSKLPVAASSH
jgi:hypothetical protein